MKPFFSLLLGLMICLSLSACNATDSKANTSTNAEASVIGTTETTVALSEQEQIESILKVRIEEAYDDTEIDHITINDDLGTEVENDYIALVYLTWNCKNSGKTSKEMLKMYSDDLAATLAEQNDSVQEIAIFWTVPYLNDNAKCSYERRNGGFAVMDTAWGKAFS